MSIPDNIESTPAGAEAVDKIARDKAAARARAAASRLARKRALPAEADNVCETIVLCLLDAGTLPPSKQDARRAVVADVVRQAHLTLEAMGHPDVHASIMSVVHAMAERLRTEKWHHPLAHGSFARPPSAPTLLDPHAARARQIESRFRRPARNACGPREVARLDS